MHSTSHVLTVQERAALVDKFLAERFPTPEISLNFKDHYTLLIAVLLSARCTDAKVNQIAPKLFAIADNPYDMIKLSVEQIQKIIQPCGLSPAKAKGIFELSHILVNQYQGQVPRTFEELEELPAIGHKSASVVMAQAFNEPAFPVDTHIHRLAQMWGLTQGKTRTQSEIDLKSLFPPSRWNSLHLQMIHYGREICPARGCDRLRSPLCQACFPNNKIAFKSVRS